MKKNLIALAVLLVLVAVAAQFTRHGGKNAEWVALENDMQVSLEALWQQPGQKVEVVEALGGVRAVVTVAMPPQGDPTWNEPFLHYVQERRHPTLALQSLEIRDSDNRAPATARSVTADVSDSKRRYELLRRQQQAQVDGALGPGQGLLLLQFRDLGLQQRTVIPQRNRSAPAQEADAPSARARGGAPRPLDDSVTEQATPIVIAPATQLDACLVVQSDFSREQLQQAYQGLSTQYEPGEHRVLKLPAL